MTTETSSLKTRSCASCSSARSNTSSTGSAAAKARARAEAAKARLTFAEEEVNLKLQKAKVEASMEMLQQKKEVAAAVAEAEALEAAIDEHSEKHSCKLSLNSVPLETTQRTEQYVIDQTKNLDKDLQLCDVPAKIEPSTSYSISGSQLKPEAKPFLLRHNSVSFQLPDTTLKHSATSPANKYPTPSQQFGSQNSINTSNPLNSEYPMFQNSNDCSSNMNDFVRYLARRELVSTGLLQFNDKPQNYRAWKRSFQNATFDLNLTPSEEMDLLLKWLGKESAEQVEQIRAIHINHPQAGLAMAWDRLDQTYGSAEIIEHALFKRIDAFPKIANRDYSKLSKLSDLLMELQSAKAEGDLPGLVLLDTARGIYPIIQKLPFRLQEKWASVGAAYKRHNQVPYPPFAYFVDFVSQEADIGNDPSFSFVSYIDTAPKVEKAAWKSSKQHEIFVHKTAVSYGDCADTGGLYKQSDDCDKLCLIHKRPHPLNKCRVFLEKSTDARKAFLREHNVCFKCCSSTTHIAKNCKTKVQCSECKSEGHNTVLHPGHASWKESNPATKHGGEGEQPLSQSQVDSKCTEVCGENQTDRSCSKVCLVKVFPAGQKDKAVKVYAILDEQSNRSLVRSQFFEVFSDQSPCAPYILRTCAGVKESAGRRASGYEVESLDGTVCISLPSLIECNDIPNNRDEIPTPDVARSHTHLKSMAHFIPELDPKAPIMLLLGRDVIRVHKVRKQVNGPHNLPYAQKLDLGWVIVGNVCLGNVHKPLTISTFHTNTIEPERPTLFKPCPNVFHVKETCKDFQIANHCPTYPEAKFTCDVDCLGDNVFQRTKEDNQVAPSIQDATFMKIMDEGLRKDSNNSWVAPLPFKSPRPRLPNNRIQALKRLISLKHNFERKPIMKEHFLKFMEKIFKNGHAELAPPLDEKEEQWYLPTFGVYHPKKVNQIRVVFDSSAQHNAISLNDVLLTGPDLNNTLVGVMMRFRKEAIAFTADIEQMFYCFLVREEDRDFLRFLWFQDNDTSKDIVDYRMRVHVFGNKPSPAVAIHCLHKSVQIDNFHVDSEVKQFVMRDFYVDDGLKSLPTVEATISLLKKTQEVLSKSNLRLHKIAANSKKVMEAFPSTDHACDLKDLDFEEDTLPMQRSLGLNWDLHSDCFRFSVSDEVKPYTRRGVLSTINRLYDPLGFVAPVTIQGKAILRELTAVSGDWDAPLPQKMEDAWTLWRVSLSELANFSIPRVYTEISTSTAMRRELCVFADASIKAIAAVSYLKVTDDEGKNHIGFVMGKAKLAPRPEHTVPRLELCAAVLAVELADLISVNLDLQFDAVTYYTDSKVVLGYICNETRRFYVYVSNRVQRIRRSSSPDQWRYVPTEQNPADHATRFVSAAHLQKTNWLSGPNFLLTQGTDIQNTFNLVNPSSDPDVRPLVSTLTTTALTKQLGSERFAKFSSWNSLTGAITRLIHIAHHFKTTEKENSSCKGWHYCKEFTMEESDRAINIILRAVQEEAYSHEIECIKRQERIPKSSPLHTLDPFIDQQGLLRVGGRLHLSSLNQREKTPLLIPGKSHIATLIIRHHHERVQHQGRHFTEGAVRAAGFWIIGGKRRVSSIIHQCVTCRRLRAPLSIQKMANLPAERLSADPPFTNVGLDVFGPWNVSSRRTRGGLLYSKRWAVIFTCMSIRAVHIEVIESLDTSSFINALRRFLAVRGPVKHIRSDRGTNFVGACKELQIPSNIDSKVVKTYLSDQGCTWTFNPPHASHCGGSWERMIGLARRILDSMFLQLKDKLTHEVLVTFMAEVTAIINARPLVPVSTDPHESFILTPAALLTQKVNPVAAPTGEFGVTDLYKCQWRQVQHLSNTFWDRWRKQFLPTLQPRRKWQSVHPNVNTGSVVLLKNSQVPRNEWPLGLVTQSFPSKDGKVRQVEVKVIKPGGSTLFLRPVTEVVLLLSSESKVDE
ncbi:uncharacterized protein [Danio rerio]|uniref:Uncharacterized protein n=1 Tax=Danio rerio TaxID=7955 RepID=A0AC58GH11_DANRE|nr:uncharacterized protein LOC108191338 [Danio rerio]|eukprot:XP_017213328.1 uncharacterized protein LOC108191338 [Danio rerio]